MEYRIFSDVDDVILNSTEEFLKYMERMGLSLKMEDMVSWKKISKHSAQNTFDILLKKNNQKFKEFVLNKFILF